MYVHAFFEISPKYATGTAPAREWLQFLNLFNEREDKYILTRQQLETIVPYCELNQDVEMTPEDFIRLLYLIRHEKIKETNTTTKNLFDSRPRSSKLISKKYYNHSSHYSTNHPDFISDYQPQDDNESINHPVKYLDYL
jgi:hypothetical protein